MNHQLNFPKILDCNILIVLLTQSSFLWGSLKFTSPHILAHMLKASNCSQRLLSPTNVLTTQALFPWDLGVKKGQTMKREKERGERTTSQCGRKNNLSLHGVPSISYRWLHCMIALTDNIDMRAVPDYYLKLWR